MNIGIGLALGILIAVIGMDIVRIPPMEELYAEYNHITLYEDGSYASETVHGEEETGCIATGICNR